MVQYIFSLKSAILKTICMLTSLPIKCLIVYPDQEQEEYFSFNRVKEPVFDRIPGYVRMYKVGIKLPIIKVN